MPLWPLMKKKMFFFVVTEKARQESGNEVMLTFCREFVNI
jgi:hypothetical protein